MKKYTIAIDLGNYLFKDILVVKNGHQDFFERSQSFFLWLDRKLRKSNIYLTGSFPAKIENLETGTRIICNFNMDMQKENK